MARPRKDGERRAQIMSAFETCVMREGLGATSLEMVAAEAGLPRGLVRYFVGNRDQMVEALFERIVGRFETQIDASLRTEGIPSVGAMLDYLFAGDFDEPTISRLIGELWYIAERDEGVRARLKTMYGALLKLVERSLERADVGADKPARERLAALVLSLALGVSSMNGFGFSRRNIGLARAAAEDWIEREKSVPRIRNVK